MASTGHQLFSRSPKQQARIYARSFGRAAVEILKANPGWGNDDVAAALFDYFEPQRLEIGIPLSITTAWSPQRIMYRGEVMTDAYLYEARLKLVGSGELWRLVGAVSHRFFTRVSLTDTAVRLRVYLPTPDTDAFRALIEKELAWAREIAASQGPAIGWIRTYLMPWVHLFVGNYSFEAFREEAQEQIERIKRQGRP